VDGELFLFAALFLKRVFFFVCPATDCLRGL
jgi:hypothetical protein